MIALHFKTTEQAHELCIFDSQANQEKDLAPSKIQLYSPTVSASFRKRITTFERQT